MSKTRLYTTDYAPSRGGVARYLGNLAEYFSDSMDVIVLSPSTRWWQALRLLWRDRRETSSAVVSHVLPIGTAAMLLRWATGTPYVVIVHGMDIGLAKGRLMKRVVAGMVLRGARIVVTNTESLKREVVETFGVSRTAVVYPTIEATDAVRLAYEERRQSSVPSGMLTGIGPVNLLTVARLVPRKGHVRMLEAMALLRHDRPAIDIRYEIVGDGPYLETIAQRIGELGLDDRVTIVRDATDDQLASHYASADLFVMPVIADTVDREGFGMVYLEAAQYGVPSIATRTPGVDEAILDGVTGILIPDGDIAGLADAVYRLAMNDGERRKLGDLARKRVLDEFTPDRQFAKLKEYL